MYEVECPKCGMVMNVKKWHEDHMLVEEYRKCPECGYVYHWSYGALLEDGVPEDEEV